MVTIPVWQELFALKNGNRCDDRGDPDKINHAASSGITGAAHDETERDKKEADAAERIAGESLHATCLWTASFHVNRVGFPTLPMRLYQWS